MTSQVFAYVETYQIAYSKYMQVFVYQLYLNKAVKNKTHQKKIVKEKKEKVYTNYNIRNEIGDNNIDSREIKNMTREVKTLHSKIWKLRWNRWIPCKAQAIIADTKRNR